MSSQAFESNFRWAVRRIVRLGQGIVVLALGTTMGFGAAHVLAEPWGIRPPSIELLGVFGAFVFLTIMLLIHQRAKTQYSIMYPWFLRIFGLVGVICFLCGARFTEHFPDKVELAPYMALTFCGTLIGSWIFVSWHPLTRKIGGGSSAERLGDFLGRLGHAGTYLVLTVALAAAVYYLLTWEPPPVPGANQGHTFNQAIILLLAHILWDWWPAKYAAVGMLGYMVWVGLGAVREALIPATRPTSHGEARTAYREELWRAKLIPRRLGIYLGYFIDRGRVREQVGYEGGSHLLTIGPSGSGKGMGLIVPNLATLQQSIFVIDPKGEAAAITARARARFSRVIIINPFNVLVDQRSYLASHGFNPLGDLSFDDNFTDDAAKIALALVKEQGGSDGAFFSGSARDLLTALIMYEKIERREKASLGNVRKLLTEPYGVDNNTGPFGLALTLDCMSKSEYEPLRSKSARFKKDTKSNSDVISTAANETQFLDSPAMQRDLQGMTIDWNVMKRELTTVYLILPADRLETHANYLRLVVTSALRSLLRSPPSATPVLFMLDEFAQLGYLPPIENAIAIGRGFGVQLWPIVQDLNQLKAIYKDRWQTFIGNTAALTAFAPQDLFTAEHLSKLCGQKTEIVKSGNESLDGRGGGINYAPQGFPLFRPEELMRMPRWQMLVRLRSQVDHPFFTHTPGYWDTPFAKGLDQNPYQSG